MLGAPVEEAQESQPPHREVPRLQTGWAHSMKLSKMRAKARAAFRRSKTATHVVIRGRRFGKVDAAVRGYDEGEREKVLRGGQ